ncbi:MAG: tRNA 2-thiouridine(34) synthase MnmA [Deltaproteobacteria bacterium]|nr:tRNA 2-thiouridine(34) synthase MnmA [Deltaproteobacteria bacterium]
MVKNVLVGISGGVDSAVAAAILQKRGYRVEGLYLQNGFPVGSEREAAAVADRLGFPLHTLDIMVPFRNDIVDYFAGEYLAGRTPNPCIVCNKQIKFRYLLEEARTRGLDSIATGHYARVEDTGGKEELRLLKGIDRGKDQSYFLFQLGQEELRRLIFPNGDRTKKEIQEMALGLNLPPRKESQEICFIPDDNYRTFLETYPATLPRPGNIVDSEGNTVGKHRGTHTVTIGQRKGLNIASRRPYYVLEIHTERNEVIVGREEDQFACGLVATACSWISGDPVSEGIVHAKTHIRYRHRGIDSQITLLPDNRVRVQFETPRQVGVAPGQGAVFFQGDRLLGGGWIERGLHDV